MNTSKHKGWRLLAVLLTFTLVAAACSSDDDGDTTTAEETTTTTAAPAEEPATTTAAPADEPATTTAAPAEEMGLISEQCPIPEPADGVSVDIMGWEFPVTQQFANEFEECNSGNLEVNAQLLANQDAQDAITLDLGTGSPAFEIVQVTNSTVGEHAANLLDLGPLIDQYSEEFGLDDISDAFWESGTVDGKILGIPITANTLHFFYNSQILADNGVTPPTTFAEVIEACGVLRDAGFDDPFNLNVSVNWANDIEFYSIILSLGGDILNDDNTPAFNSPEGLAAVEHMLALRDACMSAAGRTFSIDDSEAALRAGELPMASIWASRAAQMDDPENSLVVDLIEFAPSLFTEEGSLRNGIGYIDLYAIPADTEVDPEIIFQVLMAAVDVESQNAAAAHAAVTRSSARNAFGPRNNEALTVSVAEGVGARPKNPAFPLAGDAIGDEVLEVLQNDADPQTALDNAEARYIEEATDAGFL